MRAGIIASGLRPQGLFNPASLPGLDLWLRSEDLAHLADGDPIAHWADSSPAGNHATQPSAASQPLVSYAHGRPSAWFAGDSNWWLDSAASPSVDAQTIFAVVTVEDNSVRTPIGINASGLVMEVTSNRRPNLRSWAAGNHGRILTVAMALSTPAVIGGVFDVTAGESAAWLDDHPEQADTVGAIPAGRNIRIGIKGTNAERHYGHTFEALHYSTALSPEDRTAVRAYLAAKWGTPSPA